MPTINPYRPTWLGEKVKRFGSDPFYQSAAWRKFRRMYIMQHPLCIECDRKGIIKQANIVDHIIPITQGGEHYNENNLQSLCNECHNKKRGKESHKTKY